MTDPTDDLELLTGFVRTAARRRGLTADELAIDLADALEAIGAEEDAELDALPLLHRVASGFAGPGRQIHVACDADLRLPAVQLAAVGIVASEALSNALAHAFPAGREGDIWVRLTEAEGRLRLAVRDNGVGMPDTAGNERSGRGLIDAAAQVFGGYARLGSAPFGGAEVSLVIPRRTFAAAA